jgi:glycosyltransferase involved in cell wall biosynthesis
MKRILYHYGSAHYDTGSPRSLTAMIDLLDRARYEPLFLGPGEGPLVDELRRRDVAIIPGERARAVSYRAPVASARLIRAQFHLLKDWRIDLVHVNEFGWNQDLVLAGWFSGIPVILHIHNAEEVHWTNLHWLASGRILIPSEAHKDMVGGFHRISSKTAVQYNPVDLEQFANGRPIREQLGVPTEALVVLTVAQIRHGKGIDIVIDVADRTRERYPDVIFLIAGPDALDEMHYAEQMRGRVRERGLTQRVRFLGSRSDIPDLLASSDLFFLPTRAESFGIVVLEAMGASVPVIASAVGGIPEIISNPGAGALVDEVSASAFAGPMRVLLGDEPLRRRIGRGGRDEAMARFGRSRSAAALNSIYDDLVDSHRITRALRFGYIPV